MLDDEDDKKIKESADHYHPEYDDSAWEKMVQLLDQHLPVEKERKRRFFIMPLLLTAMCLLFLIGFYYWKNEKPDASQNLLAKDKTEKTTETGKSNGYKKIADQPFVETEKNIGIRKEENGIKKDIKNLAEKTPEITKRAPAFKNYNENVISAFNNDLPVKPGDKPEREGIEKSNNKNEINQVDNAVSKKVGIDNELTPGEKENRANVEKPRNQKGAIEQHVAVQTEKANAISIRKQTNKTKNSFANNFAISFSAGPDISSVYQNKIGKLTVAYGAGIGYSISKKLTIRTGFYFSEKIYSVGANDYKLPAGSLGNYEYLENVNANCAVYEIPVKLNYNFGKSKDHNWFVSGGLSSYLMKKEAYDYNYKTPAGQTYSKDWSISNKNKHFFSVLAISGGYQYSLNKQLSIIAEPYVNMPLTGIGAGKVKLNSGGILFTVNVKPFLKGH